MDRILNATVETCTLFFWYPRAKLPALRRIRSAQATRYPIVNLGGRHRGTLLYEISRVIQTEILLPLSVSWSVARIQVVPVVIAGPFSREFPLPLSLSFSLT